jgi:dihydroneopterin aldolase/2-amino-4-hydroxy-6-hydroxymethyldihydropteridine diphosphokinase/dihydropteroate synthase
VRAEKPSALTFAKAAGVEITREGEFFEVAENGRVAEGKHDVILALGSNMGDRLELIKEAIKELERRGHKVKRTSNLYQSAPMYVTDQPTFLNGACQVCLSILARCISNKNLRLRPHCLRTSFYEK